MECLQKIWKSLCLLNPDSWAKVYINWASPLITSMWEVLWGWVVNRASHSLEIRQMFGFSHSGYTLGCIIVSKKLPFFHWGQNATGAAGSSSISSAGSKGAAECWQLGSTAGSQPCSRLRAEVLRAFPSLLWLSHSLTGMGFSLLCKGGNVSNKTPH